MKKNIGHFLVTTLFNILLAVGIFCGLVYSVDTSTISSAIGDKTTITTFTPLMSFGWSIGIFALIEFTLYTLLIILQNDKEAKQ